MTDKQINFLMHQYLRDYHLSLVEVKEVAQALKTANNDIASVIAMLMTKRPVKETV